MKIPRIFSSKTPTELPAPITKKAQDLLLRMNSQTQYSQGTNRFSSNILGGLVTKTGSLIDTTAKLRPVESIYEGRSTIEIKKLSVAINPLNGKLLQVQKSYTKSWKKAFAQIEKFLDDLQANFDNQEIVEKRFVRLGGVTQNSKAK